MIKCWKEFVFFQLSNLCSVSVPKIQIVNRKIIQHLSQFYFQMKLELFIAVLCVVACLGETEKREKRQNKPGRFLSLPVPQKCATRKCY